MSESLTIQGRRLSPADLHGLRQWVGENPHWSRWRLSRELATRWDWRNGAGVLKDMAARTLLVKLAQRGLIGLPARRQVPTNRMRCGPPLRTPGKPRGGADHRGQHIAGSLPPRRQNPDNETAPAPL